MKQPSLETPEDLFALVSTMPGQDKFIFLGTINRLKKGRIGRTPGTVLSKAYMLRRNGQFELYSTLGKST